MLSPEANHNIRFGREDQDDIEYQVINISQLPEANQSLRNSDCWLVSDMAKVNRRIRSHSLTIKFL